MIRRANTIPVLALLLVGCAHTRVPSSPIPETGERLRYAIVPDSGTLHLARVLRFTRDTLFVERLVPAMTGGPARWEAGAVPTASLARLERRVGRRGNTGRGALIGTGVGLVVGILCANEDPGWLQPSPAECIVGYTAAGAGMGAAIGALVRSDVWQPMVLPLQPHSAPGDPVVSGVSVGIGMRIGLQPASSAGR
jgi:hypothetical protein